MNQTDPPLDAQEHSGRGKAWAKDLTKQVALRVRHHREQRGMSTQKLADACTAAGFEVNRTVLVNLENAATSRQRESVSVQLLLVLARALDVPPLVLLLPIGAEDDAVEILPGTHTYAWPAFQWITGEAPLVERVPGTERLLANLDFTDPMRFDEAARPIKLYREHSAHVREFAEWIPLDTSKSMNAVKDLVRVRQELAAAGLDVPPLTGDLAKAVAAQEEARP